MDVRVQYSYRLTSAVLRYFSHEYFEKLQPFLTRGGKSYESLRAARLVHPAYLNSITITVLFDVLVMGA